MIHVMQQFADSTSGIGALGFDGRDFLIQLITFLLALFVLQRYAFKPIAKILRERRETIDAGVKLGEDMKKQQAKLEEDSSAILHAARVKADAVISEAQDAARQTIRDAETKAQAKVESMYEEAKDHNAQELKRARKQLESEIVALISDATEAIIEEKVDSSKDAELIDKALGRGRKLVA